MRRVCHRHAQGSCPFARAAVRRLRRRSSSHPAIAVTPRDGLIDAAPRIRISGAPAGAVLRASTATSAGDRGRRRPRWRPCAGIRRGRCGACATAPTSSSRRRRASPCASTSSRAAASVAHTTIRRRWSAPGVRHAAVRHGLYGEVFDPAGERSPAPPRWSSAARRAACRPPARPALLAPHGYPALALAVLPRARAAAHAQGHPAGVLRPRAAAAARAPATSIRAASP